MRIRQLALATVLLVGLSGCSAVSGVGTEVVNQVASQSDILIKTDIANAKTAVIAYTTDSPGSFPRVDELERWGYSPAEGQQPVTLFGDTADFCIEGVAESGTVFHSTLTGSVEEGSCP